MATELTEALQKNPERAPAIMARIPAGRWGTPEDMKGLAVFLVSDAAEYVQGQVIAIDGGWMGR
jgi:2-deoxy-D-gluconate 3-dehydrogenase